MSAHIRNENNHRRTLCGRLTHKYQIVEDLRQKGSSTPRWTLRGGEYEVPPEEVCEDCRYRVRPGA